ncbi:hypothetical protein GCM10027052_21010 [Parafrigoribacterium mesophilum]|uniref:DUF3618 domain-containing protein n=1 Tax=Parafrigoribacterium mesophilum TaxID=433646 RepID=UPI0031FBFEA1
MKVPSEDPDNRVTTLRAELEDTLDAIEDKLNVPKQMGRLKARATASYEDRPVPWIIGATAVVILAGGLVAWALFGKD